MHFKNRWFSGFVLFLSSFSSFLKKFLWHANSQGYYQTHLTSDLGLHYLNNIRGMLGVDGSNCIHHWARSFPSVDCEGQRGFRACRGKFRGFVYCYNMRKRWHKQEVNVIFLVYYRRSLIKLKLSSNSCKNGTNVIISNFYFLMSAIWQICQMIILMKQFIYI